MVDKTHSRIKAKHSLARRKNRKKKRVIADDPFGILYSLLY